MALQFYFERSRTSIDRSSSYRESPVWHWSPHFKISKYQTSCPYLVLYPDGQPIPCPYLVLYPDGQSHTQVPHPHVLQSLLQKVRSPEMFPVISTGKMKDIIDQNFLQIKVLRVLQPNFLLLRNGAHTLLNFTRYQIKHRFAKSFSLNLNILLINEGNTFPVFSLLYMGQNWQEWPMMTIRRRPYSDKACPHWVPVLTGDVGHVIGVQPPRDFIQLE